MHSGEHSISFADAELAHWTEQIRAFLDHGADVYVYFNNDTDGHAVRDAQRLRQMLTP